MSRWLWVPLLLLVGCTQRHADGAMILNFEVLVTDARRSPVPDAEIYLYDIKLDKSTALCRTREDGACEVTVPYAYSYEERRWFWQSGRSRGERFQLKVRRDGTEVAFEDLPALTAQQAAGREAVRVEVQLNERQ